MNRPEAPLERPVLTADVPRSPVACLLDAQCEADLPYLQICICDDACGTNPRTCKDSKLLDDIQMTALVNALSRFGLICQP
jgi:hypothetical protein